MFRVPLCPSSGAQDCTDGCMWYISLWFTGRWSGAGLQVLCPVSVMLLDVLCGKYVCNKTTLLHPVGFYSTNFTTMHGQTHIKFTLMDSACAVNVVHVQTVTSYTALLFLAAALCGILNITPRSLYPAGKIAPCTHWEVGCVGPGVGLDVFGERKPHCAPGIDSASNRNECQKYFLGVKGGRLVGLTTLPHSCADCLEIWESQPPGTLRACPGLYKYCFILTFSVNESQRECCRYIAYTRHIRLF
jgi:hypothetical protein